MARSFLFPQDQADAQTTRLIATAAQCTGFMKGEPGAARAGWYRSGENNAIFLGELHTALAATYPEAGSAFWAVRMWTNLIWQPAYLAVIAVHLHGSVPDLAGLTQQRRGIYVDGYRLRVGQQAHGSIEAMITNAGGQLKAIATEMLVEVSSLVKLKPLPARRLFADRMLTLMIWLGQNRRDLPPAELSVHSNQWLAALGLTGQGDLEPVQAPGGREVLIVKRKGCCLDYLIDPGRYCTSCPKQDNALRIARQTANVTAELS